MTSPELQPSNTIKCLMIGPTGVGKSTFLKKFPNSEQLFNNSNATPSASQKSTTTNAIKPSLERESFIIKTVNEKFENITIEIENIDISLETCLHDSDLIVNSKVIPSNQIINISNFKVIILCFAMDDFSSFELVRSKWEIELKKNKKSS